VKIEPKIEKWQYQGVPKLHEISPKLNMSRLGEICRTWANQFCLYTRLSE